MSVRVAFAVGVAFVLASAAAAADEGVIPKLKAGMWTEVQSVHFSQPGTESLNKSLSALTSLSNSNRFCVDDAVQDKIGIVGAPAPSMGCTRRNVTKSKDGVVIEFACHGQQGAGIPLKIEAHGDFSTTVKSELTVGRGASGGSVEKRQFRYLGACTGGLKPGEILISGMPKTRMDLTYPPPVK
ncbi:DUF3617 family protein [Phenylobacterium montanum]|uniref:DUF3617 family protein n=1 Tax=Phenylobacterium montanum TaxID=2823693 RepID=A0A975G1D0_9CAUL|nr:DUF3617 family protein [Caulobacter sp. S6]QUD88692.1 DUF3617 family protein [Caulobacter sp. S6]